MGERYVLDASAAGKLFRNEEFAEPLREFVGQVTARGAEILAPEVFNVEVRNLVAKTAREVAASKAPVARDWLGVHTSLMEFVQELDANPRGDLDLAIQHGITVQDAQYLEAARSQGAILISYDARQSKAAQAARITVETPRK